MSSYQPGAEIAGYRIESLVGRGGMAVVYRAEDLRLGRKVALKLLTPQLAGSEQFRARFIRESRLAASLDHPNIVPIYEAGEADGQLFIAMRYVLGSDLKGLLGEQGGRLSAERTLRLMVQIGDALDSAHRAGLVHRDVKPGNILVVAGAERARPGLGDHVYLTDFGLTKRAAELSGGLTGTGHFLGTVDYVSPEQIQGRPVGAGTDIYALGCVLYECLTGQLPFRRDDDAALLWAHLVESPPPVTGVRPELPGAVDAVVARAMAKDPADRYASCEEFIHDLELALALPAPVSSPVSAPLSAPGSALSPLAGRPARDDGEEAAGRLEAVPDSTWAEPGAAPEDVPGGSQHPSFPAGPPPPLPIARNAAHEATPPANREPGREDQAEPDEDPGLAECPGSDRHDDAGSGWVPGEWDDPDRGNADRGEADSGEADRGDGAWGRGDQERGEADPGEPAPHPARPLRNRRWRLVALAAAAAALLTVAAVLVRSFVFAEDYRTYTSDLTVVPFRLDHPADWRSAVGTSSDIVLGPRPTAAADLFFSRGVPEAWASTADTVRAGAPDDVWLYVWTQATTFDTSEVRTLQGTVTDLLPTSTRFEPAHREVTVGGAPAVEMAAVTSDPANPQTRLRVMVDVVQPSDGRGAVLLAFFSPPGTFEDHRATFEKVRDSLQLSG
jgi:serine/threonine protein kinase